MSARTLINLHHRQSELLACRRFAQTTTRTVGRQQRVPPHCTAVGRKRPKKGKPRVGRSFSACETHGQADPLEMIPASVVCNTLQLGAI